MSSLVYGQRVEPIPEVIALNTVVFVLLALCYSCNVSNYPKVLSFLFVCMWWFACCNQGFIMGSYQQIWRCMDFLCAAILGSFLFYRAFLQIHYICVALLVLATLRLCAWQMKATTHQEFVYRVQVWHLFCGLLIVFLIVFDVK